MRKTCFAAILCLGLILAVCTTLAEGETISNDNGFTAEASYGESSFTIEANHTVYMSVTAHCDEGGLHYQWYGTMTGEKEDAEAVANATGSSLEFSVRSKPLVYYCEVQDDYGHSKDVWFQITVDNKLQISSSGGANKKVEPEATIDLAVSTYHRYGSISYQWAVRGMNEETPTLIQGATEASITTEQITRHCYYICTVYDDFGNSASCSFRITVDNQLTATAAEGTISEYQADDNLNLIVTANRTKGDLHYQWGYNSPNNGIEGAVTNTLTVPAKTGRYYCTVTDDYENSVSVTFQTTVENNLAAAPGGDLSLWIVPNSTATLSVTENCGKGAVSYQWYNHPDSPYGWPIEGETGNTLITPTITQTWGTQFYCIVSDEYGNNKKIEFSIRLKNQGTKNANFTLKAGDGTGSDMTISYTAGMTVAESASQAGYGQFYKDEDNCIALKIPQCPATFISPTENDEFDGWILTFGSNIRKTLIPGEGFCTDASFTAYTLTARWKNTTTPSDNLSTLILPSNLKTISSETFEGTAAEKIIVPTGVVTIESRAFAKCPNLIEIELPQGITTFAKDAFAENDPVKVYGEENGYLATYAENVDNLIIVQK